MLGQNRLIPPLDSHEESTISTGSEHILKDYASKCFLFEEIDLKTFLHNSDFNADDVDKGMLGQFANFIDSGDSKIISMHQEGDGAQKLELFKRRF